MKNTEVSGRRNGRILKLADLLKREREALGLSQEMLARELKLNRAYLSRLERGEYANPSAIALSRIARRFGISMDTLCAMLDETSAAEPPHLASYMRVTHPHWPESVIRELEDYYHFVKQKHGL